MYTTLRALAAAAGSVRGTLYSLALSIRKVWLIGDNLYSWIITLSTLAGLAESVLYNLASDWLDAYNELRNKTATIPGLSNLLYYLDDLLSLVQDFEYNVLKAIKSRYPDAYKFITDPIEYILETLYRYTGLGYDFIHNPRGVIDGIIKSALKDVMVLIDRPYDYFINAIAHANPNLYRLIIDPDAWLTNWFNAFMPALRQFVSDPDGYVIEHFMNGIEGLLDRYIQRIMKLFERILNAIF